MRFVNKLRSTTISRRLAYLSIVQLGVTILSVLLVLSIVITEIANKLRLNGESLLATASSQMQSLCEEAEAITKFPVITNNYGSSILYDYLLRTENSYSQYMTVRNELIGQVLMQPDISLICLLDQGGQMLYCPNAKNNYSLLQCDVSNSLCARIYLQNGGNVILSTKDMENTFPDLPSEKDCFWSARAVMKLNHLDAIGIFFCRLSLSQIRNSFENSQFYDGQQLILKDGKGIMLFQSFEEFSEINLSNDQSFFFQWKGTDYFCQCYSGESAITGYLFTPIQAVLKTALPILIASLVLSVFSAFAITYLVKSITQSIRNPISRFMDNCKRVQAGDFSSLPDEDAKDEMHSLIQVFNTTLEKIRTLIDTVYRKETLQAQTEALLVRSQMNPHFVYNTLESIRAEAVSAHQYKIADMTVLLGKTLRYGISNQEETVTVEQELFYLQDYIALQKMHLGERLEIYINVDPELYTCRVLRLVLQPLVENAIHHGLPENGTTGSVHILGFAERDTIVFTVGDHGPGIEKKELENLMDFISGKNENYTSIGLRNTHRRLQLQFGPEYGLTIRSIPGLGTTVTVRMPKISSLKEKDENETVDCG